MHAQASYEPSAVPTFKAGDASPAKWDGGSGGKKHLLALGIWEGDIEVEGESVTIVNSTLRELDEAMEGLVAVMLQGGDFKGKKVRVRRRASALTHERTSTCTECSWQPDFWAGVLNLSPRSRGRISKASKEVAVAAVLSAERETHSTTHASTSAGTHTPPSSPTLSGSAALAG